MGVVGSRLLEGGREELFDLPIERPDHLAEVVPGGLEIFQLIVDVRVAGLQLSVLVGGQRIDRAHPGQLGGQ